MRIVRKLIVCVLILAFITGVFFAVTAILSKIHKQSVWDEIRSWGNKTAIEQEIETSEQQA